MACRPPSTPTSSPRPRPTRPSPSSWPAAPCPRPTPPPVTPSSPSRGARPPAGVTVMHVPGRGGRRGAGRAGHPRHCRSMWLPAVGRSRDPHRGRLVGGQGHRRRRQDGGGGLRRPPARCITRWLGADADPSWEASPRRPGPGRLLLCSDGLWDCAETAGDVAGPRPATLTTSSPPPAAWPTSPTPPAAATASRSCWSTFPTPRPPTIERTRATSPRPYTRRVPARRGHRGQRGGHRHRRGRRRGRPAPAARRRRSC